MTLCKDCARKGVSVTVEDPNLMQTFTLSRMANILKSSLTLCNYTTAALPHRLVAHALLRRLLPDDQGQGDQDKQAA